MVKLKQTANEYLLWIVYQQKHRQGHRGLPLMRAANVGSIRVHAACTMP